MSSMATTPNITSLAHEHEVGKSLTQLALIRLRKDYLTLIAMAILVILALLSLLAPVISNDILGISYRATDTQNKFLPIGAAGHLLGTDDLGRDHLVRLLYGGQVSLTVAFLSAMFSLIVGVSLGLIAGFNQGGPFGYIDGILLWFITTLNSIPSIYLLVLIAALLKPTVMSLVFILSIFSWTFTMRIVRGQTLVLREKEYVLAAQALGAGPLRIMYFHILPNIFSLLAVDLASNIGALILTESTLSFLNLGVREPTPSWGNMLSNAQSFFRLGPHLVIFPGLLIVITVLCLFIIGDGLRDAFDPQANKKV